MTIEKLEFLLPAVFTIGPEDNELSLKRYAKLLANAVDTSENNVEELVRGIVEGETRVITAGMVSRAASRNVNVRRPLRRSSRKESCLSNT